MDLKRQRAKFFADGPAEAGEPRAVSPAHRSSSSAEYEAKSVGDAPRRIRAAGLLRYNRESDHHRQNPAPVPPEPQPPSEYPVKCEYCGGRPRPSLDLTLLDDQESFPVFCCDQRQDLCEILLKQRCLVEKSCDLETGGPAAEEDRPTAELEELLFQSPALEDPVRLIMELPRGTGKQQKLQEDESGASALKANGSWTADGQSGAGLETPENQRTPQFGLCYQDGRFLQRFYPSGNKFFTQFPDGSAQVFYPTGLLALVIVVSKEDSRECIVFDDSHGPVQPIRGVFKSDGKATCYHSNGKVWLSMDGCGGQCVDEEGARQRQWRWGCRSATPLLPFFLSLNKTVGVQVLEQEQVFVSFVAEGQQAKFRVGRCCPQGASSSDRPPGPPAMKEEILSLSARLKIQQNIQHLHQGLAAPLGPPVQNSNP